MSDEGWDDPEEHQALPRWQGAARAAIAGSVAPAPRLKPAGADGRFMRSLAVPELVALRELRRVLARGGLPPAERRTPEDHARIASFRALEELLHLLDQYRRRAESGERCRLVEREHAREPGRLLLEIAIEGEP